MNKELTDAQSDRIKKQALYEFAKSGELEAVPQLRDNSVLQDLQKRRSDLSVQYTEAVNQYGPSFPKVSAFRQKLRMWTNRLPIRAKVLSWNWRTTTKPRCNWKCFARKALDQQKADTNVMSEKMVQYNILQREADANKALYEGLLTKLKEAGITAGLRSSNIHVVDPALIPSYPSRPAKARNIALAFLVGLIGGIGLALLREYLDNTVKTPDDIETLARLPSLAVVPAFGDGAESRRSGLLESIRQTVMKEGRVELVAQHLPQSQISEAFRALAHIPAALAGRIIRRRSS